MSAPKKNLLEWVVFAVSVAVILACVSLLVSGAASSRGDASPDLHVETGSVAPASGGFAVPVTVVNRGHATAEQVRVEVALVENGQEVEKGELLLAFVPRASRREGVIVFRRDPRCCSVSARTTGYETP